MRMIFTNYNTHYIYNKYVLINLLKQNLIIIIQIVDQKLIKNKSIQI